MKLQWTKKETRTSKVPIRCQIFDGFHDFHALYLSLMLDYVF